MLKADELIYPDSCLNRAKNDEPIFVLRGKDPVGAQAVRHWASLAEAAGLHAEKLEEARKFADRMEAYAAQRGSLKEAQR